MSSGKCRPFCLGHQYGPSRPKCGNIRLPCMLNKTIHAQIVKFMGPTWGPPGSCWSQMGPKLAPWTLLSGWALFLQSTHGRHTIAYSSAQDIGPLVRYIYCICTCHFVWYIQWCHITEASLFTGLWMVCSKTCSGYQQIIKAPHYCHFLWGIWWVDSQHTASNSKSVSMS